MIGPGFEALASVSQGRLDTNLIFRVSTNQSSSGRDDRSQHIAGQGRALPLA